MGTHFSAASNVMTLLLTPGRSLLRWRHSGAMQASVFYEKSDLCHEQEPLVEKVDRRKRQLDFAKMPLKQSHKERFLFASMQIGKTKEKVEQFGLPPLLD